MFRAASQLYNFTIKKTNCRCFAYVPIKRPSMTTAGTEKLSPNKKSNEPKIPSLPEQLRMRITTSGPISVAQYMNAVLTQPNFGYYMNRDVFGQQGDFITSPEISQIFGELLAIWIYAEWQKCGAPKPFQLIELGPGRGTLIKDIIRVLSKLNRSDDFSVHLVEISPFLCKLQSSVLCLNSTDTNAQESSSSYHVGETITGIPISWYRSITDVPSGFSVILAHEFFDALPVHKFEKSENIWREILIDIDPNDLNRFRLIRAKNETAFLKLFQNYMDPSDQRAHIEYSFQSVEIMENLSKRLEADGGFGLIADYGHYGDKTDTFRAFKNHQLWDPLQEPGAADLTCDVDFRRLQQIAEQNNRSITFGPTTQQQFLCRMGAEDRLTALINANSQRSEVDALKSGLDMLINPNKMGERFKFLAMFPSVLRDHLTKFPVNGFS